MNAQATHEPSTAPSFPDLREATLDDYQGIITLEKSQGLNPRSFADWSRLWTTNPAWLELRNSWPIGWVLESEGRIVGTVGNIPLWYHLDGRRILAAAGRAWTTEPAYRTFAPFLMSEFFSQPTPDIIFNTTVNSLAAEPFSAFGSTRVPLGDWQNAAFWITRHRGFAASALRLKRAPAAGLLSFPAGLLLYLKDVLTASRLPSAPPIPIESLTAFDARFDSLWDVLRAVPARLMAQRDRQTLEWHFAGDLASRRLRILAVPAPNGIAAYAILKRKDQPEIGLTRLRLVDWQFAPGRAELAAPLLRRALELCAQEGVHALEHVGCAMPKTELIDRCAPYRRKLPAWSYYWEARDPHLRQRLTDPALWEPSSYDGDSSL